MIIFRRCTMSHWFPTPFNILIYWEMSFGLTFACKMLSMKYFLFNIIVSCEIVDTKICGFQFGFFFVDSVLPTIFSFNWTFHKMKISLCVISFEVEKWFVEREKANISKQTLPYLLFDKYFMWSSIEDRIEKYVFFLSYSFIIS